MSNFIPKVFLCLLIFLYKVGIEIQDFPAPTAIYKDFQGLEFLF